MPTWLVTGGSGFLGRHLLDRLAGEPVQVVAIGRHRLERPDVRWIEADLADPPRLLQVLEALAPSAIFHLAGKTPPADSQSLYAANQRATVNLIDALAAIGRPTRVILTGSAAELGPVPTDELPVGEAYPARPDTDYGRSKLAATEAALAAKSPIETVIARVFNPIGPGLPASQALGRFAAMLASGSGPLTLDVGDLESRRDFIDVRDVAEALVMLARADSTGLFHVGTGQSRSIGEGLDALIRLSGRDVRIVVDPSRPRGPADSRADARRITGEAGWAPRISFEESVADLWAEAIRGRG